MNKLNINEKMIVYSGTTLENYITCVIMDDQGNVFFDKRKEPKHNNSDKTYFDDDFKIASIWANICAGESGSKFIPLIMEGELSKEYSESCGFMNLEGLLFPVNRVWMPKLRQQKYNHAKDYYQVIETKTFFEHSNKVKN